MSITNINELWGRKWQFKDNTSIPNEFSLRNSVTGVKFATFYLGEEARDVYQTDNSVGNIGITTQGNFIRIGVSESSFTYAYAANGWVGKPAILDFIENVDGYTLSCTNEENFLTWFNENATEYIPPFKQWAVGIADAIRDKKGTSNLIPPLNFEKEIRNIYIADGEGTLKTLLDTTKSTKNMFLENTTITELTGLINYNATSEVTNMSQMFKSCSSLITAPEMDTKNVTKASSMFNGCSKLQAIPLFNFKSVTDASMMFYSCSKLQSIPPLNFESATDLSSCFADCRKLTTITLLNTNNVTSLSSIFSSCYALKTVECLDTSSTTTLSYAFNSCNTLTKLPKLYTSNVTSITQAFKNCNQIVNIDMSHYNITSTSNASESFYCCHNLKKLILRNVKDNAVLNTNSFSYCYHILGTVNTSYNPEGKKDGFIYVPYNTINSLLKSSTWAYVAHALKPIYKIDAVGNGIINNSIEEGNTIWTATPQEGSNFIGWYDGFVKKEFTAIGYSNPENVEKYPNATYGFEYNEDTDSYINTNQKQSGSYCLSKFYFTKTQELQQLEITYKQSSEGSYDFGIISAINRDLSDNSNADSSNITVSLKSVSNWSTGTSIVIKLDNIAIGETFHISVKYKKDGSGDTGEDSLALKIKLTDIEEQILPQIGELYSTENTINIGVVDEQTMEPLSLLAVFEDITQES